MGSHSGATAELALWTLYRNEIDPRGAHTAHRTELDEFLPLLANGRLAAVVDSTYSLQDAQAAQCRLVSDERFGHAVLHID